MNKAFRSRKEFFEMSFFLDLYISLHLYTQITKGLKINEEIDATMRSIVRAE